SAAPAARRRGRREGQRREDGAWWFLSLTCDVADAALRVGELLAGDAQRQQDLLPRALPLGLAAALDHLVRAPAAEDRGEQEGGGDGAPPMEDRQSCLSAG